MIVWLVVVVIVVVLSLCWKTALPSTTTGLTGSANTLGNEVLKNKQNVKTHTMICLIFFLKIFFATTSLLYFKKPTLA
jgi:hypothetical protein